MALSTRVITSTSKGNPLYAMPFHLYILRLRSGALYVGVTSDLNRRYAEHLRGGCWMTKIDPPLCLAYSEEHPTLSAARRRESQVKHWTRAKKEALVAGNQQELRKLAVRRRG